MAGLTRYDVLKGGPKTFIQKKNHNLFSVVQDRRIGVSSTTRARANIRVPSTLIR